MKSHKLNTNQHIADRDVRLRVKSDDFQLTAMKAEGQRLHFNKNVF